jgi:hypothetical protein
MFTLEIGMKWFDCMKMNELVKEEGMKECSNGSIWKEKNWKREIEEKKGKEGTMENIGKRREWI